MVCIPKLGPAHSELQIGLQTLTEICEGRTIRLSQLRDWQSEQRFEILALFLVMY